MNIGNVMTMLIMLFAAFIMFGIGLSQIRSVKPVGFYSGQQPPKPENITDVRAWNAKHGMMWVVYGAVIVITSIIGGIIGDSIWCVLPFCGGVMVPLPFMIWYHHKLIRLYVI